MTRMIALVMLLCSGLVGQAQAPFDFDAPELPEGMEYGAMEDMARWLVNRIAADMPNGATVHVYLRVEGDAEASGQVSASSFEIEPESLTYKFFHDGSNAVIRSNKTILLDPTDGGTANAEIQPATVISFPYYAGPKLYFWGRDYAVDIAALTLLIRSDKYINLGSDENSTAFTLNGDTGDLVLSGGLATVDDIETSGAIWLDDSIQFQADSLGTKIRYYSDTYHTDIESLTLAQFSDQYHAWFSDESEVAGATNPIGPQTGATMVLNAVGGDLWISGRYYGQGDQLENVDAEYLDSFDSTAFLKRAGDTFTGLIQSENGQIQFDPTANRITTPRLNLPAFTCAKEDLLLQTNEGDVFLWDPPDEDLSIGTREGDSILWQPLVTWAGDAAGVGVRGVTDVYRVADHAP